MSQKSPVKFSPTTKSILTSSPTAYLNFFGLSQNSWAMLSVPVSKMAKMKAPLLPMLFIESSFSIHQFLDFLCFNGDISHQIEVLIPVDDHVILKIGRASCRERV